MPLRVEFFGLPGSGKTSVARALHEVLATSERSLVFSPALLRDDAGAARRIAAKVGLVIGELGRDRVETRVVREALAIPQPTLRDAGRSVFTLATAIALYRHLDRRDLPAVIDQGVLQALWSVRLRARGYRNETLSVRLLDVAARSTRVHVWVNTPPEVCAQRLRSRASRHSRMQRGGATGDKDVWDHAEILRQTLLADLCAAYRRGGFRPRIVEIDGRDDPAEAASALAACLSLRPPPRHPP